jgi:eukaryotic-like serine/threonine-protein kinase
VSAVDFGKYQLQERLGEGGMAVVWRAKLLGPGGFEKTLVVKQIRDELAQRREFVDLFVAEAKLTVALTHANIVPVYELGMVDGTYFLALELVDGPPLSTIIADGPMPPPLAAYVVEQVLRGLDYAHRRGVVHRDLSSANVLVSRDGEVKIVDFGIAAPIDARGVAGGSRGYMAPEQEAGGAADARSDLYAAGVLLWELVSGRRFDGAALSIPALQDIVGKATARVPDARFAEAAAMLAAVSRFLRSATGATTQAELGALVRRRAPDIPLHARDDDADADDDAGAPRSVAGPRTAAIPRAGRAVTFATRIAPPPARVSWGGRVAIASTLAALVALSAFAGARLRGTSSTSTTPAPATPSPTTPPARRTETPPPPAPVHLVVRSQPAGAEVLVDNRVVGTTPVDTSLPLAAGARVRVRKRDFQPLERAVTVVDGAATVDVKLAPLPRGELTLGAVPWAHVTIDGDKRPDTPLSKVALAAGPHQVRLVCPPTGKELRFTVQIEAGHETRKVADLRTQPRLVDE